MHNRNRVWQFTAWYFVYICLSHSSSLRHAFSLELRGTLANWSEVPGELRKNFKNKTFMVKMTCRSEFQGRVDTWSAQYSFFFFLIAYRKKIGKLKRGGLLLNACAWFLLVWSQAKSDMSDQNFGCASPYIKTGQWVNPQNQLKI